MTGHVLFFNHAKQTGGILGADGVRYPVMVSSIAQDCHGRSILIPGEEVDFEPYRDFRGPLATQIVPKRAPIEFDPSYRETGHMFKWSEERGFGFAKSVGDYPRDVYVHISSVITTGELRIGSWIRYLPVLGTGKPGGSARETEIEIFVDSQEPEGSEAAQPQGEHDGQSTSTAS